MSKLSIAIGHGEQSVGGKDARRLEVASRLRKWIWSLLVLVLLYLSTCVLTYRGFTLFEWWRDVRSGVVLSHAHTSEKLVAITFDDGPDPACTPRILDVLKSRGVHATFFE